MYYVRLRNPLCVGCGRALAAAAARCPYCGMHARHSFGAHARSVARREPDVRSPAGGADRPGSRNPT